MEDSASQDIPTVGRLTAGPRTSLIEATLDFIRSELRTWRNDVDRLPEESEEKLNAQLCKYLNVSARSRFPMVHFHHEEKQATTRRVDISALPIRTEVIETTTYSIYDPVLVIEGKRLPTPGGEARRMEYVSGGRNCTGGIQRFKLGVHGVKLNTVAMVGYIQSQTIAHWFDEINAWIRQLSLETTAEEVWTEDEQLGDLVEDEAHVTAVVSSVHPRLISHVPRPVHIRHLWVVMPP
jgi:hypothetical protein